MDQETGIWRLARIDDDEAIVEMSLELYAEDPASRPVLAGQIRATLSAFHQQPVRGCAVVLDDGVQPAGYAFLVSFWSNELGGEICTVDELYVRPAWRSRGCASRLLERLESDRTLWKRRPVAFELEVSPDNVRASALYERLGFRLKRNRTLRRLT
jgi:ribosomal protein S18 acetylase RimI-like enzyme